MPDQYYSGGANSDAPPPATQVIGKDTRVYRSPPMHQQHQLRSPTANDGEDSPRFPKIPSATGPDDPLPSPSPGTMKVSFPPYSFTPRRPEVVHVDGGESSHVKPTMPPAKMPPPSHSAKSPKSPHRWKSSAPQPPTIPQE